MPRHFPQFSPIAEHSLLVEFGDSIDAQIHDRVLQFDRALAARPFTGLLELVPSYAALLIRFDPLICTPDAAEAAARQLLDLVVPAHSRPQKREVRLCYEGEFAPDLDQVAAQCGLTREAVIAAHLAGDYKVFMYGFAPGYAYLAGVPDSLHLPRKPAARRDVAKGSVLIAGPQCLVSTLTMPTGWWVIGRSPSQILTQDPERPFLFEVGDAVRFKRISRSAFDAEAKP